MNAPMRPMLVGFMVLALSLPFFSCVDDSSDGISETAAPQNFSNPCMPDFWNVNRIKTQILRMPLQPEILEYFNSDCLPVDTEEEDGLEFHYDNGVLTVVHTYTIYNCCIEKIAVTMEISDYVIDMFEEEIVPDPCFCLCPFDVTTRIWGLEPGNYLVNIWKFGEIVVSGEVEIPGF